MRDMTQNARATSILDWSRTRTPMVQVETAKDAFPSGLAMAMAPLIVDWSSSSLGFGENDHYLVHNVNVASNPIEGTTTLATVRVPAQSIEAIEFVTVMSKRGRVETEFGHALLRFIFQKDRRPLILDHDGTPISNHAPLRDLLISWEAWRPPGTGFNPVAGLDPAAYALTARCFSGSVRCLSDVMLDRPWICYPLRLPNVENAGDEFLYLSLLMGDVIARQTISALLDRRIEEAHNMPDDYSDPEAQEWAEIKVKLESQKIPENPIEEILHGNIRYHILLRSCFTMALTSIDWANLRVHRRAGLAEPARIQVTPAPLPRFLDELAHGKRGSALVRLPAALHWLMHHETVIPGNVHKLLQEADLLMYENGEIVKKSYNRHDTPYGRIEDNIIY